MCVLTISLISVFLSKEGFNGDLMPGSFVTKRSFSRFFPCYKKESMPDVILASFFFPQFTMKLGKLLISCARDWNLDKIGKRNLASALEL